MRRGWLYLGMVLAAGLATGVWFVSTEEVDPAATEPAAFDLFLAVYAGAAMVVALLLCLVVEVVVRLAGRREGGRAE